MPNIVPSDGSRNMLRYHRKHVV